MKEIIPISISLSRVVAAPFLIGFCLNHDWIEALLLVIWGLFSDSLDGAVARRLNVTSRAGSLTDSISDAILSIAMVVGLLVAGILTPSLVLLLIAIWWPSTILGLLRPIQLQESLFNLFAVLVALRTVAFASICMTYVWLGAGATIGTICIAIMALTFIALWSLNRKAAIRLLIQSRGNKQPTYK